MRLLLLWHEEELKGKDLKHDPQELLMLSHKADSEQRAKKRRFLAEEELRRHSKPEQF